MVRAATAVFGAAVAIGIAPLLQFRAAPGELPGALPADGLSPAGPVVLRKTFVSSEAEKLRFTLSTQPAEPATSQPATRQ